MTYEQQTDTDLAAAYYEHLRLRDRLATLEHRTVSQAGATFYYRGRQRVTDMTPAEGEATLTTALAAHDAANPDDEYGYGSLPGTGRGWTSVSSVRDTLRMLAEARTAIAANDELTVELQAKYTGWSRFFLVTSSQGHIHSSMHCSTCRPSTTYGWLPALSGRTEQEAVAECGPALCSVCFPTAPLDQQGKLTKREAERILREQTAA